ncbi:hypothetical protein BHE74_00034049, partial [Ensete ventricosum]
MAGSSTSTKAHSVHESRWPFPLLNHHRHSSLPVRRDTAVSHGQSPPHDAAPTASSAVRSDTLIYAAGTPQPPARSPSLSSRAGRPDDSPPPPRGIFHSNGDGYISVEELRSVLLSLGLKQGRTAEDCRIMINKVDVDGDGRVDFKEFKQMMKAGGFAAFS